MEMRSSIFRILFKNQGRTRFLMGNAPDFLGLTRNRVRVTLKYGEDTIFPIFAQEHATYIEEGGYAFRKAYFSPRLHPNKSRFRNGVARKRPANFPLLIQLIRTPVLLFASTARHTILAQGIVPMSFGRAGVATCSASAPMGGLAV
ncbi:MAG: hypothetical protein ABIG63_12055 [Chloroflexota bacterium]